MDVKEKQKKKVLFVDSFKIIVSGACAVVIGLAWKDYIMGVIEKIHPFVQSKIGINSHLLMLIFMILLTVVLGLIIHWQQSSMSAA